MPSCHLPRRKPVQKLIQLCILASISSLASTSAYSQAVQDDSILFANESVCPSTVIAVPNVLLDAALAGSDTVIEADNLDLESESVVIMNGDAQIIQGNQGVFADSIRFDQNNYVAQANGNVRFYSKTGDMVEADNLELEVDTFLGETGKGVLRIADRQKGDFAQGKGFDEDYSIFAPITNASDNYVDLIEQAKDDKQILLEMKAEGLLGDEELVFDADPILEDARVYAEHIFFEGAEFQRMTSAEYTRCPEGNSDVVIAGSELEIDHLEGVGRGKNVRLRFKGVPIFYSPVLTFPIDDRRKTGFLFPSVGSEGDSGKIFSLPFYLNIAPNIDATIRPTYMSKRGVQLYSELRYITNNSEGELQYEHMASDDTQTDEGEDVNATRYGASFEHKFDYDNGVSGSVDISDVSDVDYLEDFSTDLNLTSARILPQTAEIQYQGADLRVKGLVKKYVATLQGANLPYNRQPEITVDWTPQQNGIFKYGFEGQYATFKDDNNDTVDGDGNAVTSVVEGTRINAMPWISTPIEPVYGFIKPKIAFKSVQYSLDNVDAGDEDSPSVAVPIATVDAGLYLERDMTWFDSPHIQTFEPRMMYVNVPEKNQNSIPDFDTGNSSLSNYSVLFREDRFFGGDKIGDDHHIALGFTSTIVDDESGDERMSASIGQLYYLDDRIIGLDDDAEPETETKSDIFAELSLDLTHNFEVSTVARWEQKDAELDYWTAGVLYDDEDRRYASIDYFFNRSTTEGVDDAEDVRAEINWPVSPKLQMGIDARYSLDATGTEDNLGSSAMRLVYDNCCWGIGLTARRTLKSDGLFDNSIIATLEFEGIGRVRGTKTAQ